MNTSYNSTAIIRQRGQLTIPDNIREYVDWLGTNSIVSIEASKKEIKIIPYQNIQEKKVDWKKLWAQIKRVRSYKGKRGNLSKMIVEDRMQH